MQILYGMIKKTELILCLPTTAQNILPIRNEITTQRKYHCESVFWHRVYGVITNVGHRDASLATGIDIDHIVAGSSNRNHLQIRQLF
jgi:hypothetical protein